MFNTEDTAMLKNTSNSSLSFPMILIWGIFFQLYDFAQLAILVILLSSDGIFLEGMKKIGFFFCSKEKSLWGILWYI